MTGAIMTPFVNPVTFSSKPFSHPGSTLSASKEISARSSAMIFCAISIGSLSSFACFWNWFTSWEPNVSGTAEDASGFVCVQPVNIRQARQHNKNFFMLPP